MYIGESIRTSLEEVRAHPLRSFFTLIGVILGSLALVVVLSVMDGVEAAVWQGIQDLGMDSVLLIHNRKPADRVEQAKAHLSRGMRVEDARYFEDNALVSSIGPVGENRGVITAGFVTRRVNVYGITPSFVMIKGRKTSEGRFELRASLELPDLARDKAWRLGLAAIIEETNGRQSYWALEHPPGKADFHRAEGFAYELESPERA